MVTFCNLNGLKHDPTCYKNFDTTATIDSILTNRPSYFHHKTVIETGLPDFHLSLIITEVKMSFQKQ